MTLENILDTLLSTSSHLTLLHLRLHLIFSSRFFFTIHFNFLKPGHNIIKCYYRNFLQSTPQNLIITYFLNFPSQDIQSITTQNFLLSFFCHLHCLLGLIQLELSYLHPNLGNLKVIVKLQIF